MKILSFYISYIGIFFKFLTAYDYAKFSAVGLSAVLIALALFGFFEDRSSGFYRFRTGRLIIAVFAVFIIDAIWLWPMINATVKETIKGAATAETAVINSRAELHHRLDIFQLVFPDILDDKINTCDQNAISNYVEDQWNQTFRDTVCKPDMPCGDTPEAYYDAQEKQMNPSHLFLLDYNSVGAELGSNWPIAAGAYTIVRRLFRQPDGKGNMLEPPDQKMLDTYHGYFANCANHSPAFWWKMGERPVKTDIEICAGICP